MTLRLFAVDDGMGGHRAGEVASRIYRMRDNRTALVVRDEAD